MVNFKSFIILIFVCTFFSCNNYNDDSKAPVLHETYLRFVSPKGTNVLDSIKVLEKGKYIEEVNSNIISIKGKRLSRNTSLENFKKSWLYNSVIENETTLVLEWIDWDIIDAENRQKRYEEIYEIKMKSRKIFGNDDIHTLKWYLDVNNGSYDAYKCEFDGQTLELDNDKYHKETFNTQKHKTTALITIYC